MNGASPEAMLLFFPSLHPALVGIVPGGIRFLDPGLAPADDPAFCRPSELPLTEETLKGFVRECERLRLEVRNPKDLALLAEAVGGHFYSNTTFAVREELEDTLHPERVDARKAQSAQQALCLTYLIEETLLDLAGAEELDARFHKGLAESLGFDAEDAMDPELAAVLSGTQKVLSSAAMTEEFRPSWRRILPPFWHIAPAQAGLFVTDTDIVSTWIDAGIVFEPLSGQLKAALFPDGAPDGELVTCLETGWRLLGKNRPQPKSPWLDALRRVVAAKP